jgi:methylmalonyl-CoA/ethylmalonyl-CoA epimerase
MDRTTDPTNRESAFVDFDQVGTAGYDVVGVDHLAIAVVDLEEAITWYTQGLGFRCLERRHTKGERTAMVSAVLAQGDVVIVLIQGTDSESQVSRFIEQFGPGVQHIALRVNDLSNVVSRVRSAGGGEDTTVIEGDGIRQVFLRRDAGSGVRVELIERNGGDFSDKSVEELFRTFEARSLLTIRTILQTCRSPRHRERTRLGQDSRRRDRTDNGSHD